MSCNSAAAPRPHAVRPPLRTQAAYNGPVTYAKLPDNLRIGTSSFSTDDWVGNFYPAGTAPGDYLERYADKLDTVEIDATFYRIPSDRQVAGWRDRTPEGFVFSAKIPQSVTHADLTEEAASDLDRFIDVMRALGTKLGPLVFQFPYISKARQPDEYATGDRFRERLAALLDRVPKELSFGVEVRNEKWIGPPLLDLLGAHKVALVYIDYYTTPGMPRLALRGDTATADFAYIRFLGNHREMDAAVAAKAEAGGKHWDAPVRDRTRELTTWSPIVRALAEQRSRVFLYFNNHFAGHAPSSIELFRSVWAKAGDSGA